MHKAEYKFDQYTTVISMADLIKATSTEDGPLFVGTSLNLARGLLLNFPGPVK